MDYGKEMYSAPGRPDWRGVASAAGPLGTAPPIGADESAGRIRDEIGQTEAAIGMLHEAIERFERRIDPVLSPVPPSTSKEARGETVQGSRSHLHGRAVAMTAAVIYAIERLNHLASRVEL